MSIAIINQLDVVYAAFRVKYFLFFIIINKAICKLTLKLEKNSILK